MCKLNLVVGECLKNIIVTDATFVVFLWNCTSIKFYHVQARSCLRRKHVLDSCVDKRTSALDNIHALLTHLEEAKSNAEVRMNMRRLYRIVLCGFLCYMIVWLQVLEAYKLGVAALKSTWKESGLTEDNVADTMVQVQEVSWYKKKRMYARLRRIYAVSSEHSGMKAYFGS
jgi:hypothetical protein